MERGGAGENQIVGRVSKALSTNLKREAAMVVGAPCKLFISS